MLNPEIPSWLKSLPLPTAVVKTLNYLPLSIVSRSLSAAIVSISIFCVAEVFYTFYRMSFTATSILRIKVEYLDGHVTRDMNR